MTYTTTSGDILTTAIERAGPAWVVALIGALVVGLGVIVLVAGWHRRTTRNGRHRPDARSGPPVTQAAGAVGRVLVLAAPVLLAGCSSGLERYGGFTFASPGGQTELTYPAGQRGSIDDLSGPDLTGEGTISLSDYPDTVIVLNVWGSWCGPCRGEADGLNLASTLTADKGVQFIGINVKDTREAGADFHRRPAGAVPVDLRPVDADPAVHPRLPDRLDPLDHHPGP